MGVLCKVTFEIEVPILEDVVIIAHILQEQEYLLPIKIEDTVLYGDFFIDGFDRAEEKVESLLSILKNLYSNKQISAIVEFGAEIWEESRCWKEASSDW